MVVLMLNIHVVVFQFTFYVQGVNVDVDVAGECGRNVGSGSVLVWPLGRLSLLTWRWCSRRCVAVEPVVRLFRRDMSEDEQEGILCDAPCGSPYSRVSPSFPLPSYPINLIPKSAQVPRRKEGHTMWWLIVINDVCRH